MSRAARASRFAWTPTSVTALSSVETPRRRLPPTVSRARKLAEAPDGGGSQGAVPSMTALRRRTSRWLISIVQLFTCQHDVSSVPAGTDALVARRIVIARSLREPLEHTLVRCAAREPDHPVVQVLVVRVAEQRQVRRRVRSAQRARDDVMRLEEPL
jgi:hypothetical protein